MRALALLKASMFEKMARLSGLRMSASSLCVRSEEGEPNAPYIRIPTLPLPCRAILPLPSMQGEGPLPYGRAVRGDAVVFVCVEVGWRGTVGDR